MRIGIEAQRIQRLHKHGMDKVVIELIRNLQQIDSENEYFIFVKPDIDTKVITKSSNFNIIEIDEGSYPIWEQYHLPKFAKKYNCDILHCTSNTAPLGTKIPLITTLHDIIFLDKNVFLQFISSASLYQKFGNLYRRLIIRRIIKKSQQIITVSNFENKIISKYFKLKTSKIKTVYNGVSNDFNTKSKIDLITTEKVNCKYQLPKNYLLHISNKDPRKNTTRVLIAFNDFLRISKLNYKLVLLGCNPKELNSKLLEIDAKHLSQHIILTGYVAEKDLPIVYKQAQILLFPSLREGFGIPIIEAMASGTPVITSNLSSMPEIAGDAAHLINPYSPIEISKGIIKILTNTPYRDQLIQKGLERHQEFTWKSMAEKVLETYLHIYKIQKQ